MIPKLIHFIALTAPDGAGVEHPAFARALEAARSLHPQWEVRVWRNPVPTEGFQLAHYWRKANSLAQHADLLRLEIVHRHGGVFLDWDEILKKPLDDLVAHYDFFIASENGHVLSNGVFGAVAGHPALTALIDTLKRREPDWTRPPNMTTGPSLFAAVLRWRKDVSLLPRASFYPYHYSEKPNAGHRQTYGEQLWLGSWTVKSPWAKLRKQLSRLRPRRLLPALLKRLTRAYLSNELAIRLWHRRAALHVASSDLIRTTVHGHRILLDGRDVSVAPNIAADGYYELREEIFCRTILKGGDHFIDVGANVGVFSLLSASLVGPFGRVFAYEPNPDVASLLEKSAAMNWLHDRLVVRRTAVGGAAGTGVLTINRDRLGDATVMVTGHPKAATASRPANLPGTHTAVTAVVALDDEFPCNVPIRVLKIDAEGHEADVLAGAERLLTGHCIDYVLLEAIEEASGARWPDLIAELEKVSALGYDAFVLVRHGRLQPIGLGELQTREGCGRTVVLRSRSVGA
jgi:FkbM family methyltransferase